MALITITPTITTADPNIYKQQIEQYGLFAKRVQIDVADGSLSAARTIAEGDLVWPQNWKVDLHMLVANPSLHMENILKLKPQLVIFQSEVEEDLSPLFEVLRQNEIKVGVSILKGTYPGAVRTLIEAVDHVLIFSGNLGEQGGTADLMQLEKVRIIRTIKPEVEIGWDGGANISNVRTIAQAGVSVINVGSALANSDDPAKMYASLVAEAEKQGVI